jgi:hypothetical protein
MTPIWPIRFNAIAGYARLPQASPFELEWSIDCFAWAWKGADQRGSSGAVSALMASA